MSAYMDTPHYRVNKFVSTLRVLGRDRQGGGEIMRVNDIRLTLDDLEAVVQASAPLFTGEKADEQRVEHIPDDWNAAIEAAAAVCRAKASELFANERGPFYWAEAQILALKRAGRSPSNAHILLAMCAAYVKHDTSGGAQGLLASIEAELAGSASNVELTCDQCENASHHPQAKAGDVCDRFGCDGKLRAGSVPVVSRPLRSPAADHYNTVHRFLWRNCKCEPESVPPLRCEACKATDALWALFEIARGDVTPKMDEQAWPTREDFESLQRCCNNVSRLHGEAWNLARELFECAKHGGLTATQTADFERRIYGEGRPMPPHRSGGGTPPKVGDPT